MILTTAVLFCLPGAPSAPGCLAASGRQARLRQAAAGAPASLRRTRWRGFGCRVPHTRMSPCRRGLIQPQPAALTV
ncbi:hypothetical protein [Escherichia coli]|uniref:hypothetical protein n=1 Tax=Escherichia coli TaxID=562 RepID=UPI002026BAB0|nr:hypothetical protein [Escherichia coli]